MNGLRRHAHLDAQRIFAPASSNAVGGVARLTMYFRYLLLLLPFITLLSQPAAGAGALRINSIDAKQIFSKELLDRFASAHGVEVVVVPWKPRDTFEYIEGINRPNPAPLDVLAVADRRLEQMMQSGLLLPTDPAKMASFSNVETYWRTTFQDPERRFSVPLPWDALGIQVTRATRDGPIDSSILIFDPPPDFEGPLQIGQSAVVHMALQYLGHDPCEPGGKGLQEVAALLSAVKPRTVDGNFGFDFENDGWELQWRSFFLQTRRSASDNWHVEDYEFGIPKEGFPVEGYHAVVLGTAPNPDNARLFQEFLMMPENAALVSAHMLGPSPIVGASDFMPEDVRQLVAVDPALAEISYRGRSCHYDTYGDVLSKLRD